MKQLNHLVDDVHPRHSRHAAHTIAEVTGFEPGEETLYGITGNGFYFWDETEPIQKALPWRLG